MPVIEIEEQDAREMIAIAEKFTNKSFQLNSIGVLDAFRSFVECRESLADEVADLNDKIGDLESEFQDAQGECDSLQDEVDSLEARIEELEQEVDDLKEGPN